MQNFFMALSAFTLVTTLMLFAVSLLSSRLAFLYNYHHEYYKRPWQYYPLVAISIAAIIALFFSGPLLAIVAIIALMVTLFIDR